MEARVGESDATDLSRLAWLCIRTIKTQVALRWAHAGLEKEP